MPNVMTSRGPLIAIALVSGIVASAATLPEMSFAAGKTVKTRNLRMIPREARPAMMRAVRQLATRAGRPSPAAQDIPTPEEMNLICGGEDWLVMWTEDSNGQVEEGSVQASCGDNKIDVP